MLPQVYTPGLGVTSPAYIALQALVESSSVNFASSFFSDTIRDFSIDFLGFDPEKSLGEYTNEELVNNLKLSHVLTAGPGSGVDGALYLQEVAKRGMAVVDQLSAKWEGDVLNAPSAELDSELSTMNMTEQNMFKQFNVAKKLLKELLSPVAKKNLNKATRRDMDGLRVSKEEHEYKYCLVSGQLQEVYTAASMTPPQSIRYGAWVESPSMRKAIAKLRQIRRLTHSKNATALTALMGTNPGQLYLTVRDDPAFLPTWTTAAGEFTAASTGS